MSAITRILAELFVVGPQAKDLDHVFFLKNLIDEAMLDVYMLRGLSPHVLTLDLVAEAKGSAK
jgi:hypothetical protein